MGLSWYTGWWCVLGFIKQGMHVIVVANDEEHRELLYKMVKTAIVEELCKLQKRYAEELRNCREAEKLLNSKGRQAVKQLGIHHGREKLRRNGAASSFKAGVRGVTVAVHSCGPI